MNATTLPSEFALDQSMATALKLSQSGSPVRAHAIALGVHEAVLGGANELLLAQSAECLAECCVMMALYEQGIGFARMASRLWQERGDTARQAGMIACLSSMLAWIGEPDAVIEASTALELAEQAGDPRQLIRALQATGLVLGQLMEPDRGLVFARRSVSLSREAGIDFPVALSDLGDLIVCAALEARRGRDEPESAAAFVAAIAEAIELTWEARRIARQQGDGWVERLAINNIAEYSVHVGDTVTADRVLLDFDDTAGEPTKRCQVHHLSTKGRSLAVQGRLQEAIEAFTNCLAIARATDDLSFAGRCALDLCDAHAALGEFEAALASHRMFHDFFVQQASEAARRRARMYALHRETETLRESAAEAHSLAARLAASNALLARQAEELARSSLEDPLTKLPNRRRWDSALRDLDAGTEPYAIAVMDVDHFKQVNDRYSHSVGDEVLRAVGGLLGDFARRDDLVARYGGEEFTLLMRDVTGAQAAAICERLRQLVQDHDWTCIHPDLTLTMSVGVATGAEAATHDAVVQIADARLYEAKRGGRNRVVGAAR